VDDPHCRPPAQHPSPVLLLHGAFALTSWRAIGPALAHRGYCVFTLNYGEGGTGEIALSAHQLARFVNQVLARTGAARVSIVGHSEGGMMPRYYVRFLRGAAKVDDLVGLSPPNHGTLNPLLLAGAAMGCTACAEQEAIGSPFLNKLNAGVEAPGPVSYTVLQTIYDAVVRAHHERDAAATLPPRHRGPRRDAARSGRDAMGRECPGPQGAGRPGVQAAVLRLRYGRNGRIDDTETFAICRVNIAWASSTVEIQSTPTLLAACSWHAAIDSSAAS
jgi:pimeloyl-ACP methyl ester carboxylesterase